MERRPSFLAAACILAVALSGAGCSKKEEPASPTTFTPMAQATSETGAQTSTPLGGESAPAAPAASSESKPVEQSKAAETTKK